MAGGIQIPSLERTNPTPDASVGRYDDKVPDTVRGMQASTEGIDKVGTAAEAYFAKVEKEAAHVEAIKGVNDYESTWKQQMYGDGTSKNPGVKFIEGDPKDAYKKFDETMTAKFQEITNNDNLSSQAKDLTLKMLTEKQGILDAHKLQEYGSQTSRYQGNVTRAAISNEKDNLTDSAAFIKAGDPSSFAPFDSSIAKIRSLSLGDSMRVGTAVPDENGETVYVGADGKIQKLKASPMATYDLRKDLSEGIANSMENAINSGNADVAKAIKEKYGEFLDPIKKKSIADKLDRADTESQAYQAAVDTRGMKPDQVDNYLNKLTPEVRDKALTVIDANQRREEDLRTRASKKAYDAVATALDKIQRSDDPLLSKVELESNPLFKNLRDQIKDPKQMEALYARIDAPKSSDPKAISKMQDLVFGKDPNNDIHGMDPADFALYKSRLSKSDQKKYDGIYEKANSETGAQENQRYKRYDKELQDQAIDLGLIKRNQFGKIAGDDEKKLIEMRNDLQDHLDAKGTGPESPKDIKDYARSYVTAKKAGVAFEPAAPPEKFQGKAATDTPAPPPPPGAIVKGKTRAQWNQQYQLDKKSVATPEQLNQFIKDQP